MREMSLSLPDTGEAAYPGQFCFRVGKNLFASCGEKTVGVVSSFRWNFPTGRDVAVVQEEWQ
jgi:hypothetical protein